MKPKILMWWRSWRAGVPGHRRFLTAFPAPSPLWQLVLAPGPDEWRVTRVLGFVVCDDISRYTYDAGNPPDYGLGLPGRLWIDPIRSTWDGSGIPSTTDTYRTSDFIDDETVARRLAAEWNAR